MIVESWKKSWDGIILGPPQVKTQLKASLFTQQNMVSLEAFMKNLLTTLHERMMDHDKTVHLGEKYDYRPYSRDEKAAANIQKAEKPSVNTNNRGNSDEMPNKGNLRCKGCGNDPSYQATETSLLVTLKREDVYLNVMKTTTTLMSSLLTPSLGKSINKLAITG